jgi:hypothetical protein
MSRPRTKPYVDPFAASEPARRAAAAVLEVMAGMKSPQDVSQALGINVNRYYVLETRALAAMVKALEPLPRGRRRRPEAELAQLAREKAKSEREAGRYQALWRASQKALGLGAVSVPRGQSKAPGASKKARRPRVRAKAVLEALSTPASAPAATTSGAES